MQNVLKTSKSGMHQLRVRTSGTFKGAYEIVRIGGYGIKLFYSYEEAKRSFVKFV